MVRSLPFMCSPSIVHALLRLPTATDFNERAPRCTACRSRATICSPLPLSPSPSFQMRPSFVSFLVGSVVFSAVLAGAAVVPSTSQGLVARAAGPSGSTSSLSSVRPGSCIPESLSTTSRLFSCCSRCDLPSSLLRRLDLCMSSPSLYAAVLKVRTDRLTLRPYLFLFLCSLLWKDWSELQSLNNESQVARPLIGPFNLTIWSNARCDNGTCTVVNQSTSLPNQEPVRSCMSEPLVRRRWLPR